MMRTPSGMKMLTKLMFRLLPVQILLAAVGSVNSIEQHTIGIRMVYRMAKKVEYQNILGLNVLTIRI
ncbi:MAG: hypothetical protein IJU49_02715 [Lachnospiraceae bacterium]|nr:hypothetical protein [Lachnospiraceae bacterium]MBQ7601063.1 hypothetical protein [Lachnospiraceae bacterium]